MTEIVLGVLLTAATGTMGWSINKLWQVSTLVNRIDERTINHERRISELEEVA